ncbi:hypothetical protein [Blastopirellula marina]|uniref:Uncharacterized protein n=1 Tax=Blastopirellula marina TaxID=124 RepID=A0A2S8FTI5_9BACT|nr:hypothetical protein [Blastopirellula marina]PQO35489.1 hypothetical protein C5Y98_14110 [Blastopirellula marina]PTL44129.1 hypothetical protein C5Y97_14120 [Blastopirellula marina]
MDGELMTSTVSDVARPRLIPPPERWKSWPFFAAILAMAAYWGVLYLIAWLGNPGFDLAILLVYAGSFASISMLGILVSLPLLSLAVRLPISLLMLLVATGFTLLFWDIYDSSELHLWLVLISLQYTLVAVTSALILQASKSRLEGVRHFSLWALILTVTAIAVGLGAIRGVATIMDITWTDFVSSRAASFYAVALMNCTAAIGTILAFAVRRRLLRVLLLIVGIPLAISLTLAVLNLHDWLIPDEDVMESSEAIIFAAIQAIGISLSLLPVLLTAGRSEQAPQGGSPASELLQQSP